VFRAILGVTAAVLVLAASGGATGESGLAGGLIPPNWTHAEINYSVNRVAHTLTLDRGQVTAVSASAITLREQDGTSVQVAVSASTQVTIDGVASQVSNIRRGENAQTRRVDGGPAIQVQVHVPPRIAAAIARQAARQTRTTTTTR
jgi:hypothetical protein